MTQISFCNLVSCPFRGRDIQDLNFLDQGKLYRCMSYYREASTILLPKKLCVYITQRGKIRKYNFPMFHREPLIVISAFLKCKQK